MSLSNNYPTIRPTLEFDFANVGALDPRITFTRATSATFVNQLGVIQTAASGIPRFDYDPSTLAARGLLIEEQRTNLALYSGDFSNAAWSKSDATVTGNAIVAPDGTTSGATMTSAAAGAYVFRTFSASAIAYTQSFYAKAGSISEVRLDFVTSGFGSGASCTFNLSTGTAGAIVHWGASSGFTAAIQAAGNGWYRCSITGTATAATWFFEIAIINNSGKFVYIWGAQLEAGSFATSYIPTVASTVTRDADVGTLVSLSPWYNSTEGSFYLETNSVRFTNPTYFFVQVNLTNSTAFSFNGTSWGVLNENVLVTDPNSGVAANQNSIDKIAYSYGSGSVAISVRGSAPVSASRSIATFTSLSLGNQSGAAHLRRMAFYPKKLSDAQLQALTS